MWLLLALTVDIRRNIRVHTIQHNTTNMLCKISDENNWQNITPEAEIITPLHSRKENLPTIEETVAAINPVEGFQEAALMRTLKLLYSEERKNVKC